MKQLYSAKDAMEADALRRFLSGFGIESEITGDKNALEAGFSHAPNSALCVFVDETDFDRAITLLDGFSDVEATRLNRESAEQVLVEPADVAIDSADNLITPLSAPTRSRAYLCFEMLVVAAAIMPVFGGRSVFTLVLHSLELQSRASNFYLPHIIRDLLQVAVVLVVICFSGEHWSRFGIKRFVSTDWVTAVLVCFTATGLAQLGVGIFLDILKSMFGERYAAQLADAPRWTPQVHGWPGLVALLVLSIVIGFTEELLMRGYFFTRLEQLLRSTWAGVLLSSVFFGLMHWYAGPLSVCNAFLIGLVYGTAFAWTRSLWPVVIAHAATDLSLFLHRAV